MNEVVHLITTICMGGAEKQLLTLVDEQVKSGRKVTVVYLKGLPELATAFSMIGAELVDVYSNKNPLIQAFRIRKFLSKNENYIVHAHLPRAELLTLFLKKKTKIVLSRHNAEKFFPAAPSIISKTLSVLVATRANQIIAISAAVKSYLIDSGEINKQSKVHIVYYGFDSRRIVKNSNHEKAWLPDDCNFIVGTIARLVPQKDLYTLMKAFSIFSEKKKAAKLLIVGDGYLKQNLVEYSSKLMIKDKVIWAGRVENIPSIIRQMNIFALTSVYEGFGLVLLEAMAEGVPIVASRNSAIPEVLGDGYEGLFETGNSLMLADRLFEAAEPYKALELSNYLSSRIKMFEPNTMRINIDKIYAELERQ